MRHLYSIFSPACLFVAVLLQPGFGEEVAEPGNWAAATNASEQSSPPALAWPSSYGPGTYPVASGSRDGLPRSGMPSTGNAQMGITSPIVAEVRPCEGTRVLARVGDDVILAGDIVPAVDEFFARIPPARLATVPKSQIEFERKVQIMRGLEQRIEMKLVCLDARRNLPAERLPEIEAQIAKVFEEQDLPRRMEKAGAKTLREFDEKLRQVGTSLERQKRGFLENTLAMQWLGQQDAIDRTVSHDEMLRQYRDHLSDFETPARADWEIITVKIPRYSDGKEAHDTLARMGNRVIHGDSMAEAIRAEGGGQVECRGGGRGWITQGSMGVSKPLEEAIFSQPVGWLGDILEDRDAMHIVRVVAREEAFRTPFEEAQSEIRKKILNRRRQAHREAYLARLKREIPIWTAYDDDPEAEKIRGELERLAKANQPQAAR